MSHATVSPHLEAHEAIVASDYFMSTGPGSAPSFKAMNGRGCSAPAPSHIEPILVPSRDRFVLFPIRYNEIWGMYKTALASFWTPEEIDLSSDVLQWPTLSRAEQSFVKIVLAFFAASDGIVNENLVEQFCSEVQIPEARCFYGFQIMIENIHSEVYSVLLTTLIDDPAECDHLLAGISTVPAIQAKADWCFGWMQAGSQPFHARLIAFAAVEGIFFSSSFAAIYWLKSKGVMPGLCHSNDLIARDEGLHTDFACVLHRHLTIKVTCEQAHTIIEEAVRLEQQFFADAIPHPLIGINADIVSDYIESIADRLLVTLGYPAMFNKQVTLPFMESISLEGRTNFFERRVSDYRLPGINNRQSRSGRYMYDSFSTSAAF